MMTRVCATAALGAADERLRAEWFELVASAGVDFSMTPQWFESTAGSRGAAERAEVFTIREGGQLVGLIPYVIQAERAMGITACSRESPGSFLVAYHPDIVTRIEPEALLELYLTDAARRADVVALPNLEKNGQTARAVESVVARRGLTCITRPGHSSPFLTISGTWDQFLATKNKKFRYKVRTGLKDLEEAGTVENRWFSAAADVEPLLAEMLRVEQESWKARQGMAIGATGMEGDYYRRLLPLLAAHDALHANVLYLNAQPIAYSLCYMSQGCARQLKTSFDERYAQLSPGSACHQLAIRQAFERSAREFDFLGDSMLHKSLWATGVREHTSFYIYLPTWRGAILGRARRVADWARRQRSAAPAGATAAPATEAAES